MTGRTRLNDFELDGHLAAKRCRPERDFERCLDCLPALRTGRPAARAGAIGEHRSEEIAESAKAPDIEVLEAEAATAWIRARGATSAAPGAGRTPPTEWLAAGERSATEWPAAPTDPIRRMSSYSFRFSASPMTLYASEISLKRSAAFGSLALASG